MLSENAYLELDFRGYASVLYIYETLFSFKRKEIKWTFLLKLIPRIGGAEIHQNERERKKLNERVV